MVSQYGCAAEEGTADQPRARRRSGALVYVVSFIMGGLLQALAVPLLAALVARAALGQPATPGIWEAMSPMLSWGPPAAIAMIAGVACGSLAPGRSLWAGAATGLGGSAVWLAVLPSGVGAPDHLLALAAISLIIATVGGAVGGRLRKQC